MRPVELEALSIIAAPLDQLGTPYAFTGGSVIGFLLDYPHLATLRPTVDVDAIVAVVTRLEYSLLEDQLRQLGFHHDTTAGAPICRWLYKGITVDIMPARDPTGTMSNRWFEYALQTASLKTLHHVSVPVISAPCFMATKLAAFNDRGMGDFYGSHDLEDLVTVVDGRESLISELTNEDQALRQYVSRHLQHLLNQSGFIDALPGYLESDDTSQQRLPLLLKKLRTIAAQ